MRRLGAAHRRGAATLSVGRSQRGAIPVSRWHALESAWFPSSRCLEISIHRWNSASATGSQRASLSLPGESAQDQLGDVVTVVIADDVAITSDREETDAALAGGGGVQPPPLERASKADAFRAVAGSEGVAERLSIVLPLTAALTYYADPVVHEQPMRPPPGLSSCPVSRTPGASARRRRL
jgi:hypothetical protein